MQTGLERLMVKVGLDAHSAMEAGEGVLNALRGPMPGILAGMGTGGLAGAATGAIHGEKGHKLKGALKGGLGGAALGGVAGAGGGAISKALGQKATTKALTENPEIQDVFRGIIERHPSAFTGPQSEELLRNLTDAGSALYHGGAGGLVAGGLGGLAGGYLATPKEKPSLLHHPLDYLRSLG